MKELCKPKSLGGLGFRLFKDINGAFLAKLGWKIASGEKNLWTKLLIAKYLKEESFFQHKVKKGSSFVWKEIISSRSFISKHTYFKIGDEKSINVWEDPWVPDLSFSCLLGKDRVDVSPWKVVADFKKENSNEWDEEVLRELFDPLTVAAILKLNWPNISRDDKLIWLGNNRGVFSVRECYLTNFISEFAGVEGELWGKIWNSLLHERLKMFLWRLLAGVLPLSQTIF